MEQLFLIASRNRDDEVNTTLCDNFIDACATEVAMLIDEPVELVKPTLKEEDVRQVLSNLKKAGRDRIGNDEKEVYMFLLPKKDNFR